MTPERWHQVTAVFHAALAHDQPARALFLDEACRNDPALRAEVEILLSADAHAGSFGNQPLAISDAGKCLEPGTRLGAFRIDALIGAGGMGEVYRATDTALGRAVAIKVLPESLAHDPDRVARLQREARVLASLNHPHIAAIYGIEEAAGVRALVLELIDGKTLADRGQCSLEQALDIGRQVAEALEAAHEKGIIHRDLKPANIALSSGGLVKVLDFGLAKAAEGALPDQAPTLGPGQTAEGLIVGTVPYMSPEQARGQALDKRTDIWAFGCVLYELLTGRPAFSGATPADTLTAILEREPDWDALPPATPIPVRRLLQRMLQKNPAMRLRDIGDARIEILSAKDASVHTAAALDRAPMFSPLNQRRTVWLTVTALLSLMTAGAWLAWYRASSSSSTPTGVAGPARLVVLPFENLTRQPEDDWLAGAFSDTLGARLQPIEELVLVPRERIVELYAERAIRESQRLETAMIGQLAQRLRIRYYVHGSYQRVGDELRVSARLVDLETSAIRAQETLTERLPDVLRLQDALAERFATRLGAAIRPQPAQTPAVEAYRAVTVARGLYAAGEYAEAFRQLERAVELDPQYGEAWAWLSKAASRVAAPGSFVGGSIAAFRQRALAAAARALELRPALYDAHVAQALASRGLYDAEGWRAAARRAIELNPRLAEAHTLLADSYGAAAAWGCDRMRNSALAEKNYRESLQLDPLMPTTYVNFATNVSWMGRDEEALGIGNEGVEALPDNVLLRRVRTTWLILGNRPAEAERELLDVTDRGRAITPPDEFAWGLLEVVRRDYAAAERRFRRAEAQQMFDILDRFFFAARTYFMSGQMADGLVYMKRAFEREPPCARWAAEVPAFAPYRSDRRLLALLQDLAVH